MLPLTEGMTTESGTPTQSYWMLSLYKNHLDLMTSLNMVWQVGTINIFFILFWELVLLDMFIGEHQFSCDIRLSP